jgi:GNAT superfamily N-acetyltransferase
MDPLFTLRPAADADMDDVRTLFREYEAWLEHDLCFQGFEQELLGLPGRYAPPAGRLYLAEVSGLLAGCIALRACSPGVCEMKRLFVRDSARGLGLGRALAQRVIDDARAIGYRAMRLDTLPDRMAPANALYEALGFRDIPAYYDNPLPGVRYMELPLATADRRAAKDESRA